MIIVKMIWDTVFGNALGRILAACLAGLVALKAYGWTQQGVGAKKAVAKIEKANKHAVKKADEVGRKSRDPAARGVRDPYYSAD